MRKIILCGASCTGKTSIKHRLVELGLKPGISYTTRMMRDGEVNGIDYRFISPDEFDRLVSEGFFFEYDDTFEHRYGTSNDDFAEQDVFILTPNAVKKLRQSEASKQCIVVYLTAPINVRISRAFERGDTTGKIIKRISNDSSVFSGFLDYDIEIETSGLEVNEIIRIIQEGV